MGLRLGSMVAAAALGLGPAGAQEASGGGALGAIGIGSTTPSGSISTGRPSFAAGPGTVPRGFVQLEGGYLLDGDGDERTQTAPLLVLRAGLSDDLELRFGWSGFVVNDAGGEEETDAADIVLGFKRTLLDPSDAPYTLGVLGQVSLPTGQGAASSDSVDPSLGLLWSYDLPGPASAFGNVVASSLTGDDDGRLTQIGASVGVSHPLTSNVTGFVEYFGVFADDGPPSNNIDGGLLLLVHDDFQLDVFARVGLSDAAGDYGVGAGFGVRF